VFRALSESDERDVGSFPAGHGSDVFDFDLAGDDLVAERDDNRRYRREAVLALVGDQDAQMLGLAVSSSAAQARKSESWARQRTTVTDSLVAGCRMSVSSPQRLGGLWFSGSSSRPVWVVLTVNGSRRNARVRSRTNESVHRSARSAPRDRS
jgi:hypothetical protein